MKLIDRIDDIEEDNSMDVSEVTHVIFDLDGTLLDTESLYKAAYRKICAKHGCLSKLTPTLESRLAGQPAMQVAKTLQFECDMDTSPTLLRAELDQEIKPSLSTASAKPGAERLVLHLAEQGVPIALATSSRKTNAEIKMSSHPEMFSVFSHMVFRDDVSCGKPSPEVFLEALQRFEETVQPENVLVIEDSVSGVRAAKNAGLKVVMVPDTENNTVNSVPIVDSLEDFCPEDFGLPPFPV